MAGEPTADRSTIPLGRIGVWCNFDHLTGSAILTFAQRVDALGYDALWINEGAGREPFAMLGALAMATSRLTLGVGIASIYARDAAAAHAGALTVAELSSDRFILGLGVSHPFRVEGQRGHQYLAPVPTMRAYLEAYAGAPYQAQRPVREPPVVLAALRRRMLELAAMESDGAFPYLVPPDYIARTRATIDAAAASASRPRPLLITTLPVVLETDEVAARAMARRHVEGYLKLPNYINNLAECGFTSEDLKPPGSDRLVDSIVAWGRPRDAQRRMDELHAAGADHVALIPLLPDGRHANVAIVEAMAG